MRIIELNLQGFGKYKDYRLDFMPGVNLVYGPNESGKSTLHSFINGMFYGFVKPYSKKTIYTDEHRRFSPWSGSEYSGSILFEHREEIYRVQRIFTKGREETHVYLETTGEDITKKIQGGDSSRVLQPGEHFFGINSGVFNNTLFVGQQEVRPDRSLADEVRERLVNVSTGRDEKISVEKALAHLDEQLKDIGSKRASTSEYGKLTAESYSTEERLKIATREANKYRELFRIRIDSLNELDSAEEDLTKMRLLLKELNIQDKINIYREVFGLRDKSRNLGLELDQLTGHEDKNSEDFDEALKLQGEINLIEARTSSWKEQLDDIEDNVSVLYLGKEESTQNADELIEDGYRFQKLDYLAKDNVDLLALETEKKQINLFRTRAIWSVAIFFVLFISGSIYFLSQGNSFFAAATLVILAPVFYGLMMLKSSGIDLENVMKQMKSETEKKQILKKHEVDDKYTLYNIFDKAKSNRSRAEKDLELYNDYRSTRNGIQRKIDDISVEEEALKRELKNILQRNQSKNIEIFKAGLQKKARASEVKKEISFNHESINRILKGHTMEDLENIYKEYSDAPKNKIPMDRDKATETYSRLEARRNNLLLNLKKLEGSLAQLEDAVEMETLLEEKLEELRTKAISLQTKKDSLELARDRIKFLSGKIHRDFAPTLNESVGRMLRNLTEGKYSGVRVDKELKLGILESSTGKIVPVEDLSGGTMDQLYLGLRFGVLDELVSDKLPLFLDECFAQYDEKRLINAMEYIMGYKNRQVVIFTCQGREEKILDEIGKHYNKIDLGKI